MAEDGIPADPPRILFLARSCNIHGMIAALMARSDTYFSPSSPGQKIPAGMKRFSLRTALELRRALRAGRYDLVISSAVADPIWRQDRGWPVNAIKLLKKVFRHPGSLAMDLVPWMLKGTQAPLAVFDWEDNTIIARKSWRLLDRCAAYFKTQSPRNPYKAFLFQDRRNDCVFNIVRQGRYAPWADKLRPLSLGVTVPENWSQVTSAEKKTDVFFAGAAHYSWVRQEGLRLLEEMRAEGFHIDLHVTSSEVPGLPQDEFLRRCSQAWLVWSPEGAGWDCMRHYWAPLMGAVPLLNHPDTRRHRPLLDGVHAFYYGVEEDDIKRVIRRALADKERLRAMATAGEAHVRAHHTHAALTDYLITETLARHAPR